MNDLPNRLKAWRERGNLSQEEAARVLLVSVSAVQKWEAGVRLPEGDLLARIEKKIGGDS